jgi:hypothetical protein
MTLQEFEYIRRAMAELESGNCTQMSQAKILQTMSEITGRAAGKIREELVDSVDARLERNYQDIQNQKLLKVIENA